VVFFSAHGDPLPVQESRELRVLLERVPAINTLDLDEQSVGDHYSSELHHLCGHSERIDCGGQTLHARLKDQQYSYAPFRQKRADRKDSA
jgi:hypothetical protein